MGQQHRYAWHDEVAVPLTLLSRAGLLTAEAESRPGFLQRLGILAAGLCSPLTTRVAGAQMMRRLPARRYPIEHVLICCNENRTFDNYYGAAPFAGNYGIPKGFSQPRGIPGVNIPPVAVDSPISPNPNHDWGTIHGEWDMGKLDGFVTSGTSAAMSYTDASQLGFYYSLFQDFTLCVNYFCSLLGPTYPNRLYLAGATSGGQTTNNIAAGSLDWPIILDLLEAHSITWKVYNIGGACSLAGGISSYYCDN